jgi:hypothetical protein
VKVNEVEFADYLRTKGHDTHQLSVDLQKLRKEYHNVQNYLD